MPMIAAHETFESFIFIYVWNLLNPFDELLRYTNTLSMPNSIDTLDFFPSRSEICRELLS